MSTEPVEHVRVCPDHGAALEEKGSALICPRGHAVSHWKVARADGRVVYDKVEADKEVVMNVQPKQAAPSLGRPAAAAVAPAPPAKHKGYEVLERAKLGDASSCVLWVRLVVVHSKRSGDVYKVTWRKEGPGLKDETGTTCAENYLEPARTAYATAVEDALAQGWERRVVTYRELKLKGIPKPPRPVPSTARPHTKKAR